MSPRQAFFFFENKIILNPGQEAVALCTSKHPFLHYGCLILFLALKLACLFFWCPLNFTLLSVWIQVITVFRGLPTVENGGQEINIRCGSKEENSQSHPGYSKVHPRCVKVWHLLRVSIVRNVLKFYFELYALAGKSRKRGCKLRYSCYQRIVQSV